MFQFPGCPPRKLWIHLRVSRHYPGRVPPFGYPRIVACLQLPVAFRSWPRPSSAVGALASTLCSSSLDFLILRPTFRLMKSSLPTLTGLRLSFLPFAVVKMRRRLPAPFRLPLSGDPENDTGSVSLNDLSLQEGLSCFGRLSGLSFLPSRTDRPRFEGSPFRISLAP